MNRHTQPVEDRSLVDHGRDQLLRGRDSWRDERNARHNDVLAVLSMGECEHENAAQILDAGKTHRENDWNANRIDELEFHDGHPTQGLNTFGVWGSSVCKSIAGVREKWVGNIHGLQFINCLKTAGAAT